MSWELTKIKDVCEFVRGLTYSKSDEVDFSKNAVLRATNIDLTSNKLNLSDIRYINDSVDVKVDKKVKVNDVLICTASGSKSHLGKVAFIEEQLDMAFGGFMGVLRAKPNIKPKFLFAFLKSDVFLKHVFNTGDGANINNLKFSQFEDLELNLPPLPIQEKIVEKLDAVFAEIDTSIAVAEANANNADVLNERYFQSIFNNNDKIGWKKALLKEVCDLKSGTTIDKSLERIEGDVLYVKIGDMNLPENKIEILTSSRFVNSHQIKTNQIIPKGAIIFPKRGGAIATNKKRQIILPTIVDLNTMALIPSKNINKDYLFHWFQLFDLNTISNGANVPQINNYSFDKTFVSYPVSLEAQAEIVEKLDALSYETKKIKELCNRKVKELHLLKNSILQQAFNGELVKD